MNRLASPTESLPVTPPHTILPGATNKHRPVGVAATATDLGPFSTFAPIHYEQRYAYPLLVWLHGQGGSESELPQLMPLVSLRNYVAVAPRGLTMESSQSARLAWAQSDDGIEAAAERVFESIAAVQKRFHIHAGRIFIAGHGCGGTMAVRLAWSFPHRIRGAATIGGSLPTGLCPLSRVNDVRRLPLLLMAGRYSQAYSEREVCRDLRLLHSAGLTVAMRQYPCGDELRSTMFSDLDRWMMEFVCATERKAAVT